MLVSQQVYSHMITLNLLENPESVKKSIIKDIKYEGNFRNIQGYDPVHIQRLDDHLMIVGELNKYGQSQAEKGVSFYNNSIVAFIYKTGKDVLRRDPWITKTIYDCTKAYKPLKSYKYFAPYLFKKKFSPEDDPWYYFGSKTNSTTTSTFIIKNSQLVVFDYTQIDLQSLDF